MTDDVDLIAEARAHQHEREKTFIKHAPLWITDGHWWGLHPLELEAENEVRALSVALEAANTRERKAVKQATEWMNAANALAHTELTARAERVEKDRDAALRSRDYCRAQLGADKRQAIQDKEQAEQALAEATKALEQLADGFSPTVVRESDDGQPYVVVVTGREFARAVLERIDKPCPATWHVNPAHRTVRPRNCSCERIKKEEA